MIALMMKEDFTTVRDRFRAEKFALNLGERDSTATITVGPEAPEIIIGDILRDEDEPGAGIVWRVSKVDTDYKTGTVTLSCSHVISLLKEKLLFGEQTTATICGRTGATKCTAKEAMRYVMSFQRDFELGDFPTGYEGVSNAYSFNGDDLFSAMETISDTLEDCWWEYDLRKYPFKLHLRDRRQAKVETELRLTRNIQNAKLTVDRSGMYTRLFPVGKGDLQLTEKSVGRNEQLYGMICKTESNAEKETEEALREWAKNQLKLHAEPSVTVTVTAQDLSQQTGEPMDHIMLGAVCQMPLREYGTTILERINKMSWSDKIADPNSITVTMANTRSTVSTIVASAIKSSAKSSRVSSTVTSKGVQDIDLTTDKKDKNKYILWRQDYKGVWKDIGTFSRAVASWTVSATDGTIKVTAQPQNQSKSVKVQAGDGKWTGNSYTGIIEYSSDGGENWKDTGADFTVNAAGRYSAGWTAARASVHSQTYTYDGVTYQYFPTSSVAAGNRLQWMQTAQPSETVDGGIDDNNRYRYYVTNTTNTAYIRYGGLNGSVVAELEHGAYDEGYGEGYGTGYGEGYGTGYGAGYSVGHDDGYDEGWGAARSSVRDKTYTYNGVDYSYFPTTGVPLADRLQWFQVAQPSATVDGGIDDNNRYRYYVTNTKNIAYIRYGGLNGSIVAQYEHGAYNDGWTAARNSVRSKTYTYNGKTYNYFPTSSVASADRLNWFYVAQPSATVDGDINDTNRYTYYVTAADGYARIRYGNLNGYIVAQTTYTLPSADDIQFYAGGTGEIVRTATQPAGTQTAGGLARELKNAYNNTGGAGCWVTFPVTINGGTGIKKYAINMTP